MAQNSFNVNNAAGSAVGFSLQSQDSKEARYINTATSLAAPQACIISHDIKPNGVKGTDKHIIKFSTTVVDSLGVQQTVIASLMLSVSRSSSITDTMCKDVASFVRNFATDAVVLQLVDGITP